MSLPNTLLGVGALTEKDRADLVAGLDAGADWVALSFVQRPEDIIDVRKIVQGRAGVLAKIEKPQAIDQLEEIIKLSDAIMIARGDLGVEMPLETVPGLQKRMIRMSRQQGKPVVVATQMLESMINTPVPTRAEVSDVATAVFEGADAVMLSAESAAGDYPVEAVATMNKVAVAVENDVLYQGIIRRQEISPDATAADAISAATRQVAETLDLAAIVCYTSSGSTGQRVSRERPEKPIIALSPKDSTVRRLSLVWGLHCVRTEDAVNLDDVVIVLVPSPIAKALPVPATAWPSQQACRWAHLAPPTCCALPLSAKMGWALHKPPTRLHQKCPPRCGHFFWRSGVQKTLGQCRNVAAQIVHRISPFHHKQGRYVCLFQKGTNRGHICLGQFKLRNWIAFKKIDPQ